MKWEGNNKLSTPTYSTSIKAGAELIQTLSRSLYKNAYYVIDELLSNSYDADATKVEIKLNEKKLVIQDNGTGMDREGLENFLYLGYIAKRAKTERRGSSADIQSESLE